VRLDFQVFRPRGSRDRARGMEAAALRARGGVAGGNGRARPAGGRAEPGARPGGSGVLPKIERSLALEPGDVLSVRTPGAAVTVTGSTGRRPRWLGRRHGRAHLAGARSRGVRVSSLAGDRVDRHGGPRRCAPTQRQRRRTGRPASPGNSRFDFGPVRREHEPPLAAPRYRTRSIGAADEPAGAPIARTRARTLYGRVETLAAQRPVTAGGSRAPVAGFCPTRSGFRVPGRSVMA